MTTAESINKHKAMASTNILNGGGGLGAHVSEREIGRRLQARVTGYRGGNRVASSELRVTSEKPLWISDF